MADPNDPIYQEIKERVDRLYEARTQYLGHAMAFIVAMAAVWLYLIPEYELSESFFFVISAGGLIGFGVHSVNMLMFELRERALREELDRAGYYTDRTRKAKRDERLVRLGDDGELEDVYQQAYDAEADDHYTYDAC